jgi:uncharacterized protein
MNMEYLYIKRLDKKVVYYNPLSHETIVSLGDLTEDEIQKIRSTERNNAIFDEAKQTLNKTEDIHQLYIILTTGCNYSCKYCRQRQCKSNICAETMSLRVAFDAIDKFLAITSSRKKGVVFYGGEPMIAAGLLKDCIARVRQSSRDVELNIFTNGSLITDEFAKFLAQNDVFIIVSYDGLPECNDMLRVTNNNCPTSDQTVAGFHTYKKNGCRVGFSMTIGSHNVHKLEESIDYLRSLSPENIGFNLPHDDETNPLRTGKDSELIDRCINLFWDASEKGLYAEHIIRKVRLFAQRQFKFVECPAAFGRIVVMPNGEIGVCEGAIGYDGFFFEESNWDELEKERKKWKQCLPVFDPRCQTCQAVSLCGGGCPLDGYFQDGNLSNYGSIRCQFSKAILDTILYKISENITNFPHLITDDERRALLARLIPGDKLDKPLSTSANIGSIMESR